MDNSRFWWEAVVAPGPGPAPGDPGDPIYQSLRFRNGANGTPIHYLTRPAAASAATWTVSVWAKHADENNVNGYIFSNSLNEGWRGGNNTEKWNYLVDAGHRYITPDLTDYSAWYHHVLNYDGSNLKVWINNDLVLDYATVNGALILSSIGKYNDRHAFAGYQAAFHFLDGQSLDPTTFGRINAFGVWVPVDPRKDGNTAWYGANGFHLDFRDPNDIGKDYSGNGNDFTPTGFELADTSSPDYDWMQDSPTQNFATLNPVLEPTNQTLSDANLTGTGAGVLSTALTTQLPNCKYYWEGIGSNYYYGISEIDAVRDNYLGSKPNQVGWYVDGGFWIGTANVGYLGPAFSTTDVAMQAYDPSTGEYWVGINGTWYNGGDPATGTNPAYTVSADFRERMLPASNTTNTTNSYNFGQRPFLYTPPTDFEALQTANMPAATIADGRDHFQAITDTGANILTNAQSTFPNGLWWIKDRVNATQHQLVDSVRGATQAVNLPSSGNGEVAYSAPTGDSVAWCWSVDGPASANNDGSIETQVAVNSDAGFSIITYTGDGGAASTIGHGLGAVPEFYAVWVRTTGQSLLATARHKDLTDANKVLYLTSNSGEANYAVFGGVLPTDSVITVQGNLANNTNGNGLDFVMYAWTSVPGYSAFGSYTGNNSTDGPFVYLGFKPAFVLLKSTAISDWQAYDTTRSPNNATQHFLSPNNTLAETTGFDIDILSNGFKIRSNNGNTNGSGVRVVYAAWAENAFQSPVTAR